MLGIFLSLDLSSTTASGNCRWFPWRSSSPCSAASAAPTAPQVLPLHLPPLGAVPGRAFSGSTPKPAPSITSRCTHACSPTRRSSPRTRCSGWLAGLPRRLRRQGPGLSAARLAVRRDQRAPTAMAMVVAGKLGLYSILRFNFGLFPAQARAVAPCMIALAVIGILYGALHRAGPERPQAAHRLRHSQRAQLLHARHLLLLALRARRRASTRSSTKASPAPPSSCSLGFLYDRYGTYDMSAYGGLAAKLPMMATFFVVTALSLIGFPLLQRLRRRVPRSLSGSFAHHIGWVFAATIGVILSAAYMLWMIQRIFYGAQSAHGHRSPLARLLTRTSTSLLWPMAALMIAMGVASPFWMRAIDQGVSGSASSSRNDHRRAAMRPAHCTWQLRSHHPSHAGEAMNTTPQILARSPRGHPHRHRRPHHADRAAAGARKVASPWAGSPSSAPSPRWPPASTSISFRRAPPSSAPCRSTPSASSSTCSSAPSCWSASSSRSTATTEHADGMGEFYALIVLGTVGMMLMTCAVELLLVFIGLEISSISTYILAGFRKRSAKGPEASHQVFPARLLRDRLLPLRHRADLRRHRHHQHRRHRQAAARHHHARCWPCRDSR